jgi:hypothetical protein
VTNEGGNAYSRTTISAYRWDGSSWAEYARTDVFYSTEYELLGLPEGVYRVKFRGGSIFNPSFGIEEFYDDVLTIDDATDVAVSVGAVTPGINAVVGDLGGSSRTLDNPGFEGSLDPWELDAAAAASVHHGAVDISGSALSGSAEVVGVDAQGGSAVRQCIAVEAGSSYRFGGWSRAAVSGSVEPTVEARLEFFGDPDCAGSPLTAAVSPVRTGAHDWRPVTGVASAPVEAAAARLALVVHSPAPATFTVHLDEAFAGPDTDLVFADGFESATVSAWSLPVP